MELANAIFQSEKHCKKITTIAELAKAYMEHVKEYYRDYLGKPTCEISGVKYALKPLLDLFAVLELEEFGPLKLIDVREKMIEGNLCRRTINKRIGIINRMSRI